MKNILIVSLSKTYGGGERFISNVFFNLEKNYNIYYAVKNEFLYSLCNKKKRALLPPLKHESIHFINQYIKEKNISNVVFNDYGVISPFIKCKFKITYIHASWTSIKSFYRRIFLFSLTNISYLFSNKIIAVSNSVKPIFIWNNKTEVIYNGVNTHYFSPNKNVNTIPRLIFTGRIVKQKGVFELYKVLKSLSLDHKFKMLFVGEGSALNELKIKTKQDSLENFIQFSGFKFNIKKELLNSDIFILPSYMEACSLSLLEAMSSKLAVIVSDKGGSNEVISHGVNGLLINPFNELDLYTNISNLIKDKTYREQLGDTARKTVINNFSLKKSINKIKIILN